jgi:hypothetical protein
VTALLLKMDISRAFDSVSSAGIARVERVLGKMAQLVGPVVIFIVIFSKAKWD